MTMKLGEEITLDKKLQACRAIVLYEDRRTALATLHDIQTAGEEATPLLLPGRLLTREMLHQMIVKLSGLPQKRALLPENVLCYDSGLLLWWKPALRAPIFFKTGNKPWNEEMSGHTVLHPALLFAAKAGRLSVYALKDCLRPTGETRLCRAPYFNLYEAGNMCAGNTRLPEVVLPSDIPLWEKAFFETNFTHSNLHAGKLTSHEGGHDGFWRAMQDEEAEPRCWLIQLNLSLEGLLQ